MPHSGWQAHAISGKAQPTLITIGAMIVPVAGELAAVLRLTTKQVYCFSYPDSTTTEHTALSHHFPTYATGA